MKKLDGYNVFDFGVKDVSIASYDTNNGWGFAGGRGLEYTFNDALTAKIGRASTRHMGEFPYITVTLDGKRIFDETDSAKNKAKAKDLITSILNKK